MISPRLILMLGGVLLALSVFAYISHLRADNAELRAAIAQGALDAERVTREAVDKAHAYERAQRDALTAASNKATAEARQQAIDARKRLTALQRAIQEAADADPSVDAWRATRLPEPIRLLLEPHDPVDSGGGGPR